MAKQKQRSKAELLNLYKTYRAVKADMERDASDQVCGGASYWRTSVAWAFALYKHENFNKPKLSKALSNVAEKINDMDDKERARIRLKLFNCKWVLFNHSQKKKCKNVIDQCWNDMEFYNTEVAVDYSLIMSEWLIDTLGYTENQLDLLYEFVLKIDELSTDTILLMQDEIYRKRGIWLSLNENDRVCIESEDVEINVI